MPDYGMKISKAGDDVKTATAKNLRFHTQYPAMKMYKWSDVSMTTDVSGNGKITIAHNLNYAPAFYVMRKAVARWDLLSITEYPDAFFPLGAFNAYVKGDPLNDAVYAYADGTNLYIEAKGATANLLMNFRYYILVDNSQSFSGAAGVGLLKDYGFKFAKPGFDVKTAKEYQMGFSSKYKIFQYYSVNKKLDTLFLPTMFASKFDPDVQEVTYIDFNHGLGYAPLFIAHANSPYGGTGQFFEVPYFDGFTDVNGPILYVNGWSDATRVRLYFYRHSFIRANGSLAGDWLDFTATIKLYILSENLAGVTNP